MTDAERDELLRLYTQRTFALARALTAAHFALRSVRAVRDGISDDLLDAVIEATSDAIAGDLLRPGCNGPVDAPRGAGRPAPGVALTMEGGRDAG